MTIEVQSLTLARGGRTVLHDLSFQVLPGQVTALIGPNGSGKSSLLGAISGALPHGGQVRLNGREVARTAAPELAGQRAVMAQTAEVGFAFTAAEVVAMGAPLAPARIAALLAEVGLAGFGPRKAWALSGGEAQRLHLARALAQAEGRPQPFWLLLDEPVSSLDLAHQIAVMDIARGFAARGGGVLVVLHDLNLAVRGADRLVVLHQGRIAADGPPAQVLDDALIARVYGCALPVSRAPADAPFLLVQSHP